MKTAHEHTDDAIRRLANAQRDITDAIAKVPLESPRRKKLGDASRSIADAQKSLKEAL